MNTTNNSNQAAEVPTRSRGKRRRGRGGGRGQSTASMSVRVAQVHPNGVYGSDKVANLDWKETNSLLKGKAFVMMLGGPNGLTQMTVHRPIGETVLDAVRAWVMTPSNEIHYLVANRSSEAIGRWERLRDSHIRQTVVAAETGRRNRPAQGQNAPVEEWAVVNSPDCTTTVRTAQAAAKEANRPDSEWLDFAPEHVRESERTFRAAVKAGGPTQAWLGANPKPVHVTMGGPQGNRPQIEVLYLHGLSVREAQTRIMNLVSGDLTTVAAQMQQQVIGDGADAPVNE